MKLKVQAQHLLVGDVVGSGETVECVGRGIRTPDGCVDVTISKGNKKRTTYWRRHTMIGVERKQEVT